jgi:hypothetical protein
VYIIYPSVSGVSRETSKGVAISIFFQESFLKNKLLTVNSNIIKTIASGIK